MSLFDLIMIGISLSMDAFAVSICKGLSVRKVQLSHALICGAWFGAFQAIMPSFGYFLGSRFEHLQPPLTPLPLALALPQWKPTLWLLPC